MSEIARMKERAVRESQALRSRVGHKGGPTDQLVTSRTAPLTPSSAAAVPAASPATYVPALSSRVADLLGELERATLDLREKASKSRPPPDALK